jgi:cAMP-binding proteins - catabolite gene activator and regulatory subunit of cAMP-dependent protein kinases
VNDAWAALLGLSPRDTAILRETPLFQGLDDGALRQLLAGALVQNVAAGAALFVQDDRAERFFLLLDGWVKLYRLGPDGSEAIVGVVARGETFADAASFANAVYPVCADAVTPCRALSLALRAFEDAIAADGAIALRMLGSLSRRLRSLVGQIEHLQIKSAPQRLGAFLVELSPAASGAVTLSLPLPKALIAQRLGMRPETFSRAMLALRRVGVDRHGASITIADVAALARFSGADAPHGCS